MLHEPIVGLVNDFSKSTASTSLAYVLNLGSFLVWFVTLDISGICGYNCIAPTIVETLNPYQRVDTLVEDLGANVTAYLNILWG